MPHTVEVRTDTVVKRFSAEESEAYARERHALTVLAAHAPGLAPAPLPSAFPDLVMTRLPGTPLRGTAVTGRRLDALAAAVAAVHDALPAPELARVPPRPGDRAHVVGLVRRWHAAGAAPAGDPPVAEAMAAGVRWLERAGPAADPPPSPVFGPGDGNLANYLWDGSRVRIVDFEESGRSDRAWELAELTEHVSAWSDTAFDADAFLARFPLTPAETARLADNRAVLAVVWLFMLAFDDPAAPRNPAGTARRQAERVMRRLARLTNR